MKRKVTKQDLINRILELDTRTKEWTTAKLDKAITDSFVELTTVAQPFSSEHIEDLKPYYENNELNSSIVLLGSVINIYEMYLVKYNQDEDFYLRGEKRNKNQNVIWQNPQNKDTVYFNLGSKYCDDEQYDSAVIKYFYIPIDANFDELYLFSDEYIALEAALEVAVYEMLLDDKNAANKRQRLEILGGRLIDDEPDDFPINERRAIFEGFTYV